MTREDLSIERSIENREFQRTMDGHVSWREQAPMSDSQKEAMKEALARMESVWNSRVANKT